MVETKSKCCGSSYHLFASDENTNFYVCDKCGRGCDPVFDKDIGAPHKKEEKGCCEKCIYFEDNSGDGIGGSATEYCDNTNCSCHTRTEGEKSQCCGADMYIQECKISENAKLRAYVCSKCLKNFYPSTRTEEGKEECKHKKLPYHFEGEPEHSMCGECFTKLPDSPSKENKWEEAFYKRFGFNDFGGIDIIGDHLDKEQADLLKDFINHLLSLQRKELEAEVVICAAIRMKDGYIIRGHRHNDCLLTASKIPRYKEDSHAWGENQGFVTSKNRYVDRLEGARIQKAAGIKSKMPEDGAYFHGELYSEDLY